MHALAQAGDGPPARGGFVHLPLLPQQVQGRDAKRWRSVERLNEVLGILVVVLYKNTTTKRLQAFKSELMPTGAQERQLRSFAGACRFVLHARAGSKSTLLPTSRRCPKRLHWSWRPVTGTVHAWHVAEGDQVQAGEVIAVMETMKMEMQVTAHRAGRIATQAAAGAFVQQGACLATIV